MNTYRIGSFQPDEETKLETEVNDTINSFITVLKNENKDIGEMSFDELKTGILTFHGNIKSLVLETLLVKDTPVIDQLDGFKASMYKAMTAGDEDLLSLCVYIFEITFMVAHSHGNNKLKDIATKAILNLKSQYPDGL